MKWIYTIAYPDGSFAEVGMNNRGVIKGDRNKASRMAVDISKSHGKPVRMQGWDEGQFYRPGGKPSVEFVTSEGKST